MEPTDDPSAEPAGPRRPWRRRLTWLGIGVIGLIALVYGGIFVYANFINDSPDALDAGDLTAALTDTTPGDTEPASTEPATAATTATGLDGIWVPTAASELGYRVDEVLAGVNTTAVGRSNEIDGELTIDGTEAEVDVSVQVETITSDDSRRDGQFRGRIMDTANFPTATFRTTEPIELGALPAPGEQITATATGDLTLKGTTSSVTFDITAELTGDRIGVLGSIPVAFADYGIDNPSFGAVRTEDDGLVEFVLVFEPA
jgi:polyisoprenoid-binding protein YceI